MPGGGTVRVAAAIVELAASAARFDNFQPQDTSHAGARTQSPLAKISARLPGLSPAVQQALEDLAGARDSLSIISRTGTSLGGLFMLLRDLDMLPLSALAGAQDCGGLSAIQAFRTLTLCRLAGPGGARSLLLDAVWRNLLGLPRQVGAAELRLWAEREFPQHAAELAKSRARIAGLLPRWRDGAGLPKVASRSVGAAAGWVLARFCRRLPGFSQSSPGYLRRNILDVRASVEQDGSSILRITIDRPPLDPVLALSGAAAWEQEFDWTSPPRIILKRLQP